MKYVVDADVLIGALDRNDAHHEGSKRLLTHWHTLKDTVLVSLLNLSEVLVAPAADPERLRVARSAITTLGIAGHQPNEAIAVDASRLHGRHPISLPDAYLLATAKHLEATIASFDAKVLRAAQAEGLRSAAL